MNRPISCLIAGMLILAAQPLWAKSPRVAHVPNGTQFSCDLCHEPGNTGYVNPFGVQVLSHLKDSNVKWEEMWMLDADGDGYTNGQEMGDPTGRWSIGMPNPSFRATHPGYPDQNLCNNGTLEEVEACDKNDLRGETCETQGFAAGGLGCGSLCQYDVSGCSNCGNGVIERGDQCDGDDLGGMSCISLGYDSGELACFSGCKVDLSACVGEPVPNCGDGIRVRGEECEGDDMGQRSCTALGWSGGTLRCTDQCVFDVALCSGTGPDRDRLTVVPEESPDGDDPETDADSDSTCSVSKRQTLPTSALGFLGLAALFFLRRRNPTL